MYDFVLYCIGMISYDRGLYMIQPMNEEMKRLNHLLSDIDAVYHEAALKFGLSDSAMQILYTVCGGGNECLISDITRLSGTRKQTINSALRKLEADRIVYLESYTGRMKKVCLTEKGRALAQNTVMHVIDAENQVFAAWSQDEKNLYLELTRRYLNDLKAKVREI